jgi:hypothetical protein
MTVHNFDSFIKAEDEVTKETLRHFKRMFELYERSFNLLLETVSCLFDLTKTKLPDSTAKEVILLIIPRIIHSIESIRNLTLKGYYYDVAVLQRSLAESMGLIAYFALNEKEAEKWIEGKDIKIPKIELFDFVIKLFGAKDFSAKSDYGRLCEYVHTNVRAIVSMLDLNQPAPEIGLLITPQFDKEKVVVIASYPTIMLIIIQKIFNELPEKRREKINKFCRRYSAEIKKFVS